MDRVQQILNAAKCLTEHELKSVSATLMNMLSGTGGVYGSPAKKADKCRKCGADHIVKFGKDKNNKQRYKCKCCGATFVETSFSALSRTRHSEAVWETYIHLLLTGASLEVCAFRCGISVRTAFIWRHKILNAIQHDQDNRMMAGIIEADEMFLPVSYKGNHSKSTRFTMPRTPFRRGTDNRSNNIPKACIMCAVERNGQRYGEVLGTGQPTTQMINHAFKSRIIPDSIILSDGALAMKNYFAKRKDVQVIRLRSTVTKSHNGNTPEIRGIYHIQTVNNLHARLQGFLRKYNGVSTKYLNHYVNLFMWVENYKTVSRELEGSLKEYLVQKNCYITASNLFSQPSIPCVA